MLLIEEIFNQSFVGFSLRSYWEMPKKDTTLASIKEVKFEKIDLPFIFGRDDNFLLKTYDSKIISKIYNLVGVNSMTPMERLLNSLHMSNINSVYNNYKDIFVDSTTEDKRHFRDRFDSDDYNFLYFSTLEAAEKHYANFKACENKGTDKVVSIEAEIINKYPDYFI